MGAVIYSATVVDACRSMFPVSETMFKLLFISNYDQEYLKALGCFRMPDYLDGVRTLEKQKEQVLNKIRKCEADLTHYNDTAVCKTSVEVWQTPKFFTAIYDVLANTADTFSGEKTLLDYIMEDTPIEEIPSDIDTVVIPDDKAVLVDWFMRLLIEEGYSICNGRMTDKYAGGLFLGRLKADATDFKPNATDTYTFCSTFTVYASSLGYQRYSVNDKESVLSYFSRTDLALQVDRLKELQRETGVAMCLTDAGDDELLSECKADLKRIEESLVRHTTDRKYVCETYPFTVGRNESVPDMLASIWGNPVNQLKVIVLQHYASLTAGDSNKYNITEGNKLFWDWLRDLEIDLSEFNISRDFPRYMRLISATYLQFGFNPKAYPPEVVVVIKKPTKQTMYKLLDTVLLPGSATISHIKKY